MSILEICCDSYEDVIKADRAGADRVELNEAFALGGLTPSLGTLKLSLSDTSLSIICMVRPRLGGFCYDDAEYQVMREDARQFLEAGAHGLAFGFLTKEGHPDLPRIRSMVDLVHGAGVEAVFHRAFDLCVRQEEACEGLIACGVDRILSSGGRETAVQGKDRLRRLQERFGSRIQLLAGSGVQAENILSLREETGLDQFHSSCRDYREDPTTSNPFLSYGFYPAPRENAHNVVNEEKVRKLRSLLDA